jgi:hypothetical protein
MTFSEKNLSREYWYKKFPISETCGYCDRPIDRGNSQRILRVQEQNKFRLEDVCLKCLPAVRASVLAKKGGASIIDHNDKTVISTNPNHVKQILDAETEDSDEK